MKNIPTFENFLSEANTYAKFEVGKTYVHPKLGKFEVIELAKDSKTKVKFLEGSAKGDISYIAGYGSDGYTLVESTLDEGYMSELDVIRQEAKTIDEFIKNAKKEFPQIAKMKEADVFLHDLWEIGKQMKESEVTEAFNFSLSSNAKAATDVINAIEKNSKFLKESDMAELLEVLSATLKKVGYLGLEDYK